MNIWLWADRNAAEWDAWQDCRCLGLRGIRASIVQSLKRTTWLWFTHRACGVGAVAMWSACNEISWRICYAYICMVYSGSFITILGHGLYVHMLHPWSVHCCFSIYHTRLHSLHHWQPTRHLSSSPALSFHLYYEGFAGKVNIVSHKKKWSIYTPMNYD